MLNPKIFLLLATEFSFGIFCLQNSSTTFILGGAAKIYLHKLPESPLLSEFELFGCPGTSKGILLASYPVPVFGASMLWDSEKESLIVCGGANWTGPMNMCHSWKSNSWMKLPNLEKARAFGLLTKLNGKIHMIGGKDPSGYATFDVESLEEDGWKHVSQLPQTDDQFSNVPGKSCISPLRV